MNAKKIELTDGTILGPTGGATTMFWGFLNDKMISVNQDAKGESDVFVPISSIAYIRA